MRVLVLLALALSLYAHQFGVVNAHLVQFSQTKFAIKIFDINDNQFKDYSAPIVPKMCLNTKTQQTKNQLIYHFSCQKLDDEARIFLNWNLSSVVLTAHFLDEEPKRSVIVKNHQSFVLYVGDMRSNQSFDKAFVNYLRLGIEHILFGYDHLLFVFALLFLARKKIVLAITGFTLSHSVVLILAVLDIVRIDERFIEITIALSIMFLAREIIINNPSTLTNRHPLLIATLFGFIHGFGFANVLREIGLPQNQLFSSLLSFNLGVEIGQILFILASILLIKLLQLDRYRMPLAYVIGVISSYMFLIRIFALA